MNYTEKFEQLRSVFSDYRDEMSIDDSGLKIRNIKFISGEPGENLMNPDDKRYNENTSFSYPVFIPPDQESKNVILLLHGLNERSWTKYLTWAYYLSELTGSYIVLFPISFHVNRSPATWKEARRMSGEVKERIMNSRNVRMSSFANVALSKRLTDDPRRFFFSGYRTATDITRLLGTIYNGTHPVIPKTDNVNIFAYSIGAFLAEILMMANPRDLFSSSKLFIFCGGPVFSRMQGTSKLIMDSLAFEKTFHYFMDEFEHTLDYGNPLSDFFSSDSIGMAFRSMIDTERFKAPREKVIKEIRQRICCVSLVKDRVIPPSGAIETLDCFAGDGVVKIDDFPYEYSHENPFPVSGNPLLSKEVDMCFERVIRRAGEFYGS